MVDTRDKVAYFQAITGLDDADLCTEILAAHGWDLELAVASFTGSNSSPPEPFHHPTTTTTTTIAPNANVGNSGQSQLNPNPHLPPSESTSLVAAAPNLAWKLITLPISIISGSLGLVSGAINLGFWVAGGVLSYSLGVLGVRSSRVGDSSVTAANPLVPVSGAAAEAREFVDVFEREFGGQIGTPNFVTEGFMDALQRSRRSYKLLFVYLHSPDHPDTPVFCEGTLCSEVVAAFVNENFVSWGGSIRSSEGFKMSNSLKASRFPFCAVVMAATNQRIALLQQIEGPRSPEEMITILQRVVEETAPVLVSAQLEAEERRNNMRLREEQDAAYRAALEADQARERHRREEQERLERESAEEERKRKEEEEAQERAAREAAEREAALARRREEKALSLGPEPDKGPDVTRVLVRFPAGERKERRFHSTATIQSLHDYVDSLGCINTESYSLVSNFPRTVYGPEKFSLTLKEAGLHPQASLFVELIS
ncbi:Plant UBX domain-containing protein 10 [Dionaea muscipula]